MNIEIFEFSIGNRRNWADFAYIYHDFDMFKKYKVFVYVDAMILNRVRPVDV